jgi:hypothetical protein
MNRRVFLSLTAGVTLTASMGLLNKVIPQVIDVTVVPSDDHSAILQAALDYAAKTGGTVRVWGQGLSLSRGLHIHSNVVLEFCHNTVAVPPGFEGPIIEVQT